MSNKIQKLCYKLSLGSKAEKCVFNCLADAADDDGLCWMLVATIVERTGFADRTVRRALTALVESGLIDRQVRGGRSS
ncbi:MAG: helix-turn-helix domain-containing protein, partial [Betaproteobacteria bacterium]|nr:helix-turn-helix domain-containing protein [Betaproteobacteria bacterium]